MEIDPRLLRVTRRAWIQPLLRWSCRVKALYVHRKAARRCPAYRDFLIEHGKTPAQSWSEFTRIPSMSKENYVKTFPIEARCYGGEIPANGVVIDESSGSSGPPINWVRGRDELACVRKLIQHAYRQAYGGERMIVLNCFALGAWATGMNVTMSLTDLAIIKSIGPDKARLENTLRQFGPGYRYLIAGYPPFLKNFAETCAIDLAAYDIHAILGGEGMSEGLRDMLLRSFTTVRSSFGASDLEINMGVETPMTIALRKRCVADRALCLALFGRPTPPMLFQYNPADYWIETNDQGELIFTVARPHGVAPKVRYNLHDEGGVYTLPQLESICAAHGVLVDELTADPSALPLLYVCGRSDLTVAFYGANIYPADIEAIIHGDPVLADACNSFQLRVEELGEALTPHLIITLEQSEAQRSPMPGLDTLQEVFLERLIAVNQDFREVRKMFDRNQVIVEVAGYSAGPFADRDIRIKSRYLG